MLSAYMSSFLLLSVLTLILHTFYGKRRKRYPPGPIGIPILGNLLSIGDKMHLAFQRYAKIYGPIFSVRLANEEAIVLHGAKLIKEAFNHPAFNGRPNMEAGGLFVWGGASGIILGEGHSWLAQRRFALRNLRDFGFGKKSLESTIMDEVIDFVDWIKEHNGSPIDLHRRLSLAMVNALWTILSGKRYAQDDPKIVAILDQLETMVHALLGGKGKSLLIFFYPRIAKMFPNWSGWNYLLKLLEPRQKLFHEAIEEHKQTMQEGYARDFIDVYLKEVQKTTDPTSRFHENNAEISLQAVMADFFIAGSDTTSTTLNWAVLYLLYYPNVQAKIQDELDRVVGKSRWPSLEDRNNLPYTESFIMELMRISSIASFGAPHAVTEDIEFHGYLIPKGTTVYPSLYSTHYDPAVWGDPENFRPERFLSKDGTQAERHESLIPFSIGKRSCLGEVLARDQLFLFITSLVQRFSIVPEPGKPKPTLDPKLGQATLEPHPFKVILNDRL